MFEGSAPERPQVKHSGEGGDAYEEGQHESALEPGILLSRLVLVRVAKTKPSGQHLGILAQGPESST
jgi:hypothetical protein